MFLRQKHEDVCILLFRELEIFITKTDILRQLFDHNLAVRKTHAYNRVSQSRTLSIKNRTLYHYNAFWLEHCLCTRKLGWSLFDT